MLKPIGWWIETLTNEELPAPQELVTDIPSDERGALTRYLANGLPLIQYRGYSWCRFGCGIDDLKMGSWDFTDGIWVWPEGLAHYVGVHSVGLPEAFIKYALSGAPPTKPDGEQSYDDAYWVNWCANRRLSKIQNGIRDALGKTQTEVAARMKIRADAMEQEQGRSVDRCAWAMCSRQALAGKSICAEHYLAGADPTSNVPMCVGLQNYLRQLSESDYKM